MKPVRISLPIEVARDADLAEREEDFAGSCGG